MISDFIVIVSLLFWIVYSIAVVIYLNYLTRNYLVATSRDEIVGDKNLKTHNQLLEQYEGVEDINVLVLTGGGIRGLVPLEILAYIERKTGKKVGELFDFVSGVSTGAISAATFIVGDDKGGYKFSAKSLLRGYYQESKRIFSSPRYHQVLTLFGLFAPRFLPDNKIKVLENHFEDLTIGELKGNMLIPVYNIDQNNLQIIKNWNPPRGKSNDNYLVKDLINGASSPPMLFPPVAFNLKNKDYLFIDPAVLLNNPILHVLLHVRILFPQKQINLVLIGNGGTSGVTYNYRSMFGFGLYGLYQYLFSAPALSSKLYVDFIEEYMQDTERFDTKIGYFRVNSTPKTNISPTNVGKRNLYNIKLFAKQMLNENKVVIDEIIKVLNKSK